MFCMLCTHAPCVLQSDIVVSASDIPQNPVTLARMTQTVVEEAALSLPIAAVMLFMLALGWCMELSLLWVVLYIATVVLLAGFWNRLACNPPIGFPVLECSCRFLPRVEPALQSVVLKMRGTAALPVTVDTISLMTPLDIDRHDAAHCLLGLPPYRSQPPFPFLRRAIESGDLSCIDCGTVLGNIPMDTPDVRIEGAVQCSGTVLVLALMTFTPGVTATPPSNQLLASLCCGRFRSPRPPCPSPSVPITLRAYRPPCLSPSPFADHRCFAE